MNNSVPITSPLTHPKQSSPSFEDEPVYLLLQKTTDQMTDDELRAFVQALRAVSAGPVLRQKLEREASAPKVNLSKLYDL